MLKTLLLALGLCSAMALTASAADKEGGKKRTPPSAEDRAAMKEIRDKYDKDKDGKLSKEERESMSTEDKAKMEKIHPKAKKKTEDK